MILTIGTDRYTVATLAEASSKWCEVRDTNGWGAGEGHVVKVIDGKKRFRVSYNGRIWAGRWTPKSVPVYDPFDKRTEEQARDWHIRRDERNGRHTP